MVGVRSFLSGRARGTRTLCGWVRGNGELTQDHGPVYELWENTTVGQPDEDQVTAWAEELQIGADGKFRVVCKVSGTSSKPLG